MSDALRIGAGALLVGAGLTALAYAVYLEMVRAVDRRWWEAGVLLAPLGLVLVLTGLAVGG